MRRSRDHYSRGEDYTFPLPCLNGRVKMVRQSKDVALKTIRRNIENGKVLPPKRLRNAERRSREHLTPAEVEKIVKAAGRVGRHGHRDATLIQIAYRHGLRVSEVVVLRWDQ